MPIGGGTLSGNRVLYAGERRSRRTIGTTRSRWTYSGFAGHIMLLSTMGPSRFLFRALLLSQLAGGVGTARRKGRSVASEPKRRPREATCGRDAVAFQALA